MIQVRVEDVLRIRQHLLLQSSTMGALAAVACGAELVSFVMCVILWYAVASLPCAEFLRELPPQPKTASG